MSKTLCPLPWIHLATRPNGDVRLCCTANASGADNNEKDIGLVKDQGKILNLQTSSIEQVWNSDYLRDVRLKMLAGEKPSSCVKCYNEESVGIVSKRQWETVIWKERLNLDSIIDKTKPDGSIPVDIPYFDLRLGNLCQLKCIMCSPHDSSSWIKDWKKQYPKYKTIELKKDQSWNIDFDYTWYQKSDFLYDLRKQAANIKELYFAGGEPLLIPEHYKILEFMVETGYAKDCVLRYNSNGLELPEKLFELWNHFKQVKFNFSVDAYGERNDYIRYPSKWNNVVDNLERLDDTPNNIIVNMACAVQLLNVLTVHELADWKINKNFKKINLPSYGAGVIGTHLVYLPDYLNVRVLPQELKNQVAKNIENFCNRHAEYKDFSKDPYGQIRWMGLIKYMNAEDWSYKIPVLIDYLETTDQQRKTNFRNIFPEFKFFL